MYPNGYIRLEKDIITSIKNNIEFFLSLRNVSVTLTADEQELTVHHVNIWFLVEFLPISNGTPLQTDSLTVGKRSKAVSNNFK